MLAKNFVYILFLVVKKNIRNNFNPITKKVYEKHSVTRVSM